MCKHKRTKESERNAYFIQIHTNSNMRMREPPLIYTFVQMYTWFIIYHAVFIVLINKQGTMKVWLAEAVIRLEP